MNDLPRYTPATSKALEVIVWIAKRDPGIDVYHLVKASFFADRYHLLNYGRPIAGDIYGAAPYGPLGQVVYGLLRHDPIEILALQTNGTLPFHVDGSYRVTANRDANDRLLSKSDVEALDYGAGHVRNRTFDDLYAETHAEPAYAKATGGLMDYRDLIAEDDPLRSEKRDAVAESAATAVF